MLFCVLHVSREGRSYSIAQKSRPYEKVRIGGRDRSDPFRRVTRVQKYFDVSLVQSEHERRCPYQMLPRILYELP